MNSCPKCFNFVAANATRCEHCGAALDGAEPGKRGPGRRTDTVLEDRPAGGGLPPLKPSPPPPLPSGSANVPFFNGSAPVPPPRVGAKPPIDATPPPGSRATAFTGNGAPSLTGSVSRPPVQRGQTVFLPPPAATAFVGGSASAAVRSDSRKIVAVLITYSWKPEGQLFPIREGRNLIGSGETCDIRITEDPALSSVNSHITFRQSFTLGDMVSMSGTELNGEPVEEQFRPIANYARIRTGSTMWLLVILDETLALRSAG